MKGHMCCLLPVEPFPPRGGGIPDPVLTPHAISAVFAQLTLGGWMHVQGLLDNTKPHPRMTLG